MISRFTAALLGAATVTVFSLADAHASLIEHRIAGGSNEGQKLVDVVQAYTVSAGSKNPEVRIPSNALLQAFAFFDKYSETARAYSYFPLRQASAANSELLEFHPTAVNTDTGPTIDNRRYMVIFDLNLHASLPRLHIINLETGEIESTLASHGAESDCGEKKPGYACKFVSDKDSHASPLGFFTTGELYTGKNGAGIAGPMILLNGLEGPSRAFSGNETPSTMVVHGATYVTNQFAGRSGGCPALSFEVLEKVKDKIKDGALFYFYHASLDVDGRSPVLGGMKTKAP